MKICTFFFFLAVDFEYLYCLNALVDASAGDKGLQLSDCERQVLLPAVSFLIHKVTQVHIRTRKSCLYGADFP